MDRITVEDVDRELRALEPEDWDRVKQSIIDGTDGHYAEYRRLAAEWFSALSVCRHPRRDFEVDFTRSVPGGRRVKHCLACSEAGQPIGAAMHAAYRAARKRQLADAPRCEFCNQRATARAGYADPARGVTAARLCGRHLRIARREHAKHGIMGLLCPADGDVVRAMIKEARP